MNNELRQKVAEILQSDQKLLNMLSDKNVQWSEPESDNDKPNRKWSIVPLDKFQYDKMKMPVITIQMGDDNLIGSHLVETLLYIRCYNGSQKTYVDITSALDRVRQLLHNRRATFKESTLIDFKWQGTSAESVDQAWNIPYREARFSVQRV